MKNLRIKLEFRLYLVVFVFWLISYLCIKKDDLLNVIQSSLPPREAALLMGMVWGEDELLSSDMYRMLVNSGLIHIVVVSGANLMILGKALIENLAKYFGRKVAIVGGGGILLIYVNLVGWEIPVVRAILFLGIYYWSQLLGRRFNMTRSFFVVGLVMILADYKILGNVSFWLSMLAFTAIILNRKSGVLQNTIWVNIFVLPVISIYFGKISFLTVVSNLMVLFLVEILTIMGFLGSVIGLLCFKLGSLIIVFSYPLLRYFIEVVEYMGGIGGVFDFKFNWWLLTGWYLLIAVYWYEKNKI
ncbi:MAG TPA: ComEC/Rec2 family competence protein [Candidatus Methanoperedens sp.]|nr:ComEC/Rec2 family competence protein [Candidatus Methanoperedens sp.]